VRVCVCHFLETQLTRGVGRGEEETVHLKWNTLPNPARSIQVPLQPVTPACGGRLHPRERVVHRAASHLELDPLALSVSTPSPHDRESLSPWTPTDATESKESGLPTKRPRSPPAAQSTLLRMSSSPVQVIKRLCQSQASSLNSQSQDLFAAQARIDQLTAELNQLKLQVRDIVAASESLLNTHQLEVAAHMTTQLALNVARSQAGVPWDLNHVSLSTAAVSYKRLCLDIKFQSNMTAMTFFRAVDTMDAFFNVCLGFSYNVLPCQYKTRRGGPSTSRTTIDEHKNIMFFVLYVIRTGPASITLAAMLFQFDKASASRWSRRMHYFQTSGSRLDSKCMSIGMSRGRRCCACASPASFRNRALN
jgi:hypothetical protein